MLALTVVGVYLAMSLLSYTPQDPDWTHVFYRQTVINKGGPVGAWLADALFALFGYVSLAFPVLLLVLGWQLFRTRESGKALGALILILRMLGLLLSLVGGCALVCQLSLPASSLRFAQAGGGVTGQLMVEIVEPLFGRTGGSFVFVSLLLFGMTLLARFSWFTLLDALGTIGLQLLIGGQALAVRSGQALLVMWRQYRSRQAHIDQAPQRLPTRIQPSMPYLLETDSGAVTADDAEVPELLTNSPPSVDLLNPPDEAPLADDLDGASALLEEKLLDFGIKANVVAVKQGPVVTRFEIEPAAGLKGSRITSLSTDLARSLAVASVRVIEVIPGKSVVGIEVPNTTRITVYLSELMSSSPFDAAQSPLTVALGHDINGSPMITDLARMPHLLVAGTTGSGKSVGINVMILSILYKASPEQVRLIMIDPKILELSVYEGIPHLLTPVVTNMNEAANSLRWCVTEMERRYRLMTALGVRNIVGFNDKITQLKRSGEPLPDSLYECEPVEPDAPMDHTLPFVVVVIDEFADMIMSAGKSVEELVVRIAQKARAAGIHMILATQRPSVDVITGLIKANIPTRISFQVSSKIDSRTILDQAGAEQLLGNGDMLYLAQGASQPIRVHGAFVSDDEVHRVVAALKKQDSPRYLAGVLGDSADTGELQSDD